MLKLRFKSKVDGIVHNLEIEYRVYPIIDDAHIKVTDRPVSRSPLNGKRYKGYDSLLYFPETGNYIKDRFTSFEKVYYALKRIGAQEKHLMRLLGYMSGIEVVANNEYSLPDNGKYKNICRLVNYRKFFPEGEAKNELINAKARCEDFSIVEYEKAHHLDSRSAINNHVAELMHEFITDNMKEDERIEKILFLNHQIGFGENK